MQLQKKAQSVKVNNHIDLSNLTCCPHDILHIDEKKMQSSNSCKYCQAFGKLF